MSVSTAPSVAGRMSDPAGLASIAAQSFLLLGVTLDVVHCVLALVPRAAPLVSGVFIGWHLLVRIATMITFLGWLGMRYAKLTTVGWVSPTYSTAMAIAWFFVPVVNLYKPYMIVQELWRASAKDNTSESGGSPLILAWWLLFVGAPITLFAMGRPATLPPSQVIVVNSMNVIAAVLAVIVIHRIETRWRAKTAAVLDPDDGWEVVDSEPPPEPIGDNSSDTLSLPPAHLTARSHPAAPTPPPPEPAAMPSSPSPRSSTTRAAVPEAPLPLPSTPPQRPTIRPGARRDEEAIAEITPLLASLRRLAVAVSVLGMFSVALMVSGSMLFLVQSLSGPTVIRRVSVILALLYVGMGLIYLIPVTHQLRFSAAAKRFAATKSHGEIGTAIRMQGRFWAFVGGLVAVLIAVELTAIALAVIIPNVLRLISS